MASKPDDEESTEATDAVGGRTIPQCEPCSKNNRTKVSNFYCNDCKEFQCSECSASHKAFGFMSGHNIKDWESTDLKEKTINMFGFDKCLEHGNLVTIFCEDHEVFCCPACGFSGHKLCEKAKHIHEFSINVTEFEKTLKACNEKASQFINTIDEIGNAEIIEVKEKAEAIEKELIQKINRNFTETLKNIQTLVDALKSSKEEEITKVSNIQDDLEVWKNSLNAASKQGLHDQCFILCKSLNQKTSEYNEFLRNQSYENIARSVHAKCHTTIETFVKGNETLVKLFRDNTAIHETGSGILEKILTYTESSGECSTNTVEDTNDNQRERSVHLTNMAFLTFTKEDKTHISCIDFLQDGRLLAVDFNKTQCFLLNENLQVLGKRFTFDGNKAHPFHVCVYRENKAVVTTKKYLYFLQLDQQNNIRLKKKVVSPSCYYSITIFNCSMFLCSTYGDVNGPVRVVDFEGNETRFIDTGIPDVKCGLHESCSTYITTGIIVLTDKKNSRVHLFNILSGRCKTVEDYRIQGPTMACVAPDDTVFVSCVENDVIVRISQRGEILQELNISFEPWTVRISIDKKLVVSGYDGDNHKIQLYKLDYY